MLKLVFFLFATQALGQEHKPVTVSDWTVKNESEASIILASGNTESQTTSIKQKNEIIKKRNTYVFRGNFLRTKDDDVETGKSWLLGLRYERELSKDFRAFIGVSTERDIYSGFNRRQSADLGIKHFFIKKKDEEELIGELNYRSTTEEDLNGNREQQNYARFYLEWTKKWSKDINSQIWMEYLYNLDDDEAYFANSEISLRYILNSIISLKLAYQTKYQNKPLSSGIDRLDELYTTSLVASF